MVSTMRERSFSARIRLSIPIMASLRISAAVPWMGVLTAAPSAMRAAKALLELISVRVRRRPRLVMA